MFTKAIMRRPGANFAGGLTSANLGAPILETAIAQHEQYCRALESCGLEVLRLESDEKHPDSTFVEDTAVLAGGCAILTRPGSLTRRGEVAGIRDAIAPHFPRLEIIEAPGTLDGGDVCQAGKHVFIGLSERTNEAGAGQLTRALKEEGLTTSLVDIRAVAGLLHLKSGASWLGDRRLALVRDLAGRTEFARFEFEVVPVETGESYAANCVRVNDRVLIAAGHPGFCAALEGLGYAPIAVDVSEFRKMDGGLSCLSLRF